MHSVALNVVGWTIIIGTLFWSQTERRWSVNLLWPHAVGCIEYCRGNNRNCAIFFSQTVTRWSTNSLWPHCIRLHCFPPLLYCITNWCLGGGEGGEGKMKCHAFHLAEWCGVVLCSIPSVYGMFHAICLWHVPCHLSMTCSMPSVYDKSASQLAKFIRSQCRLCWIVRNSLLSTVPQSGFCFL